MSSANAEFDYVKDLRKSSSNITKATFKAGMKWNDEKYRDFSENAILELIRRDIWYFDNIKKDQAVLNALMLAPIRQNLVGRFCSDLPSTVPLGWAEQAIEKHLTDLFSAMLYAQSNSAWAGVKLDHPAGGGKTWFNQTDYRLSDFTLHVIFRETFGDACNYDSSPDARGSAYYKSIAMSKLGADNVPANGMKYKGLLTLKGLDMEPVYELMSREIDDWAWDARYYFLYWPHKLCDGTMWPVIIRNDRMLREAIAHRIPDKASKNRNIILFGGPITRRERTIARRDQSYPAPGRGLELIEKAREEYMELEEPKFPLIEPGEPQPLSWQDDYNERPF